MPKADEEKKPLAERGEQIRRSGGKDTYLAKVRELDSTAKGKRSFGLALCICGAVLAAVGGALAAVHIIATAVACAVGVLLLVLGVAGCAKSKKLSRQRDSMSETLGAPFSELDAYVQICLDALAQMESMSSKAIAAKTLLDAAEDEVADRYEKLSSLIKMTADTALTADNINDIALGQEKRIAEFCIKREQLSREIYGMKLYVDKVEAELSEYDREALAARVTIDPSSLTAEMIEKAKLRERFDRERYSALDKETRNLRESLAALSGGLTEDPVQIADRISELEEELRRHTEYYDALMLAKTHIEEAGTSMSGNVTPAISKSAGEMLSLVSGGAHSSVQTTKSLDLTVEQDGFHVNADILSGGTRDAAYICLRISLMLRLFGADLPPLIMDESLCQLDDTRAANMLTLLSKLSATTTQCILLTCHSRELALCEKLGIQAKQITV